MASNSYTLAILMADDGEGHREPVGVVATIDEALELSRADTARRESILEFGEDPGVCPMVYQIWEHLVDGYCMVKEWGA